MKTEVEYMLEVSYRRKDGVLRRGIPCSKKRFKELWSYFASRWEICGVRDCQTGTEWIWTPENGWRKRPF